MSIELNIDNVKGLELLKSYNLPRNKIVLMNSSWQAILGIRQNGDLDVLCTPDILKQFEKIVEKPVSIMKYVHWYLAPFGKTPQEIIDNHSVEVDGFKVLKFGTYKECLKIRAETGKKVPSAARLGKKSERDLLSVVNLVDDGAGLPIEIPV
jgi:hypothetical protein